MIAIEGPGPSPGQRALPSGGVHVWKACLNRSLQEVQCWFELLSADEKERAASYRSEQDCTHFIVGRGILRTLLASYLNLTPDGLAFAYSHRGKPFIDNPRHNLHFNVSHSNGIALFALTWGNSLGIDVEHMRTDLDRERIASHFFAPSEAAAINALPEEERTQAFFRCWTRKESYVKAIGEGLGIPFDQFTVSVGAAAALLSLQGRRVPTTRWRLYDLCVDGNCSATLATVEDFSRVRYWEYAG